MPIYQNSSVTDARIEVGNFAVYVHPTAGSTAAAAGWLNLGAGMVKDFSYAPEMFTSQAGNAVDPIQGISRETATLSMDLIEYSGANWAVLTGGAAAGTSGSLTVGGQVSVITGRGVKLVNARKLAAGTTQTTTYVINNAFMDGGYTSAFKSDNDADPVTVYSFNMLCKQYSTGQVIFKKTVA